MSTSATTLSQVESSTAFPPDDIGALLKANQKLNDLDPKCKYQLLTSEPNPDPSYYPKTYCAVYKQYRHFTPSPFKKYPWLYCCRVKDGASCRACAFFALELPGGHSTGQFVTSPFRRWRKLSDTTLAHGKLDYHLASLSKLHS